MYAWLNTHWKHPTDVVIDGFPPATIFSQHQQWADRGNLLEEMMYVDSVAYLPDDILVKVDRASMGVSLEARVPLLDHRVVEFAWQIGPDLKVRNGQSKWLLRQVLDRYVPRNLIERPKVGFGVPIDSWLRGPLREWAEELLDERRLKNDGFFQPQPIRNKWAEHLSGQSNWHYDLWDVLMFQAWLASS
jgi:asparagine synthase (glutamine-hydrolysing)